MAPWQLIFAIPKPDWNLELGFPGNCKGGLVYLHLKGCMWPHHSTVIKPRKHTSWITISPNNFDFGLSKLLAL
ncbi:hypothetical protein CUMW_075840 [Citrus unshiu]|nr:hypothetical protein CUMW_075840 [Citrus unshiu]